MIKLMRINAIRLTVSGLISAIMMIYFGSANASEKPTSALRCVQTFLDFKGYSIGPIDAKLNKSTLAAAHAYLVDKKVALPDLTNETANAWCDSAITDKAYSSLTGYSYETKLLSRKIVGAAKDLNRILLADSIGKFVVADRSIKKSTALEFVDLNDKISAARISVNYADAGHRDDWFYNNKPGLQQRYELTEVRPFSMRPGKTYWLRLSVFLPEWFDTGDQMTLTDMKPMVNGLLLDPVVSLTFAKRSGRDMMQIHHIVGRKQDCIIGYNEGGGENTYCDLSKEQDIFLPASELKGKWLNFVYRVHWANDDSGSYHLWMNDKLLVGIKGNTLHGAEFITHKFGVYRGYYHSQGTKQPNASVYFTAEGRSATCTGLGIEKCATFEAEALTFVKPGVTDVNIVNLNEMSDYLKAGGKIMKGKRK